MNDAGRQVFDYITQTVYNLLHCLKDFVSESSLTDLLPKLLDPLLREAAKRPEVYNEEQVRFEMFKHMGYFSPEGSGHHSEYVAWFRKRPDLIEKHCTHGTGNDPGYSLTPERRVLNAKKRQE